MFRKFSSLPTRCVVSKYLIYTMFGVIVTHRMTQITVDWDLGHRSGRDQYSQCTMIEGATGSVDATSFPVKIVDSKNNHLGRD